MGTPETQSAPWRGEEGDKLGRYLKSCDRHSIGVAGLGFIGITGPCAASIALQFSHSTGGNDIDDQ